MLKFNIFNIKDILFIEIYNDWQHSMWPRIAFFYQVWQIIAYFMKVHHNQSMKGIDNII